MRSKFYRTEGLTMKNFIILPDVTCDLSPELRAQFGVEDYVPGHVHFSDGRDFVTHPDWESISRKDFYDALSNRRMKITTAPGSPEEFYESFSKWAQKGYDILSMSISSKISSTYNVACGAAERVQKEFPDCRIYCLDSMKMSGSLGFLVLYAREMQEQGKTMQEIIDWLEVYKHRIHQMGPIDDLMFVARRGRISTGKAIMGSFAGVKPMGDNSPEGYVTVLTKAKGMKKALDLTVDYIREASVDLENNYVMIAHSNREEYAIQLKEKMEAALHPKKVFLTEVYSATGTNIGPGMVGAYFIGNDISENNEAEKALMLRITAK